MSSSELDNAGEQVVKQREFREGPSEGLKPWRTSFPEKESKSLPKSVQGISQTKYISMEKRKIATVRN